MYWTGLYPSFADSWQLRHCVHDVLGRYRSLELKGLVPVQDAILAAVKVNLTIPWQQAASDDFQCALRLPPRLRENDEIRDKIRRHYSAAAGRSRAEKAGKTHFLRTYVRPLFDQMAEEGFAKQHCAASSGRPIASRIADEIYRQIQDDKAAKHFLANNPDALPSLTAFEDNIVPWLKERQKGSHQKKQ